MPLIQELTDTYQSGWSATVALGQRLSTHVIPLQTHHPKDSLTNQWGPQAQALASLTISWDRTAVEKKLIRQNWPVAKQRAAAKYLSYIERYMDEAVINMYETGIPVSITLAQGILESGAGASNLARKTNNHFGIKALPTATGRRKIKAKRYDELTPQDFRYRPPAIGVSQHHDDHVYDRFEVYASVQDSYWRHSRLLLNSCKKARKGCYRWIWQEFPIQRQYVDLTEMAEIYQSVSGYSPKDFFGKTKVPYYAAQAAGLKMAGYATSKTYHKKLVYLIETYELWRFDVAVQRALG
ncbi:MAG: hypothetical protein D6772_06575 [Bacteroidetes bacterium]|nr:MAG: hypothetical protein D6772_06575 [Bacteroidota bacterium]